MHGSSIPCKSSISSLAPRGKDFSDAFESRVRELITRVAWFLIFIHGSLQLFTFHGLIVVLSVSNPDFADSVHARVQVD